MNTLPERLRRAATALKPSDEVHVTSADLDNAADEIEHLRDALDIARTGLLRLERLSEETRAALTRAHG